MATSAEDINRLNKLTATGIDYTNLAASDARRESNSRGLIIRYTEPLIICTYIKNSMIAQNDNHKN